MDHDDDEGIGFISESHYAKAASEDRQAAVSLLQGPVRQSKGGNFLSSNVNDIDVPIYSTDNLTGPKRRPATGVGLILGIAGACRTDELVNLTVDNIEDVGSSLIVKIPNTKTKIPRTFVVTDVENMLELFRKYLSLRPPHVKHKRFFCTTKQGNVVRSQLARIPWEKFRV